MDGDEAAGRRLRQVGTAAGLEPVTAPRRAISYSNDAWLFDDRRYGAVVLRICSLGGIARLEREAVLARRLPPTVRRAELLASGRLPAMTWALHRRLAGEPLNRCWPALTAAERASLVAQLAEQLMALHTWVPPAGVAAALVARTAGDGSGEPTAGLDLLPLPVSRLRTLVPAACALPWVDKGLVGAAAEAAGSLAGAAPVVDDPARHHLVHHDVTLSNLWWHDGTLTLLDLEWARFGPPDLELVQLCENAEADTLRGVGEHQVLLADLLAAYPGLCAGPDRLRLYALLFAIRHVVVWPPDGPADGLDPYHPVRRLHRLLHGGWPTPGAAGRTDAGHDVMSLRRKRQAAAVKKTVA
jgi:hypothetical protein